MNKHNKITALEGTDFQLVSQEAVNEVVIRRNSTPRKVLGYQPPQKFLQLILCKVFGLRLEFRCHFVSKRTLFEPSAALITIGASLRKS